MTRDDLANLMDAVYIEISGLRNAGQREYAHDVDNAFANFERIADELEIPREKVLWTYAMKHKDGITAFINGYKSQREDVRGRINDLIVYLVLLRGMIEEDELQYERVAETTGVEGPSENYISGTNADLFVLGADSWPAPPPKL